MKQRRRSRGKNGERQTAPVRDAATEAGMPVIRMIEWTAAILLTVIIVFLLIVRARHAGALWRDECAVVQLAGMPKLSELLSNFQRESFPAPFPLLVRTYAACFGTSDAVFRAFGVAVGAIFLLCCWIQSRLLTGGPPLLTLALLGLNTTFLVWGTSIRAYGLGSAMILLAFGFIGGMLIEPNNRRCIGALLAAVASVQLLLFNSVLLLAIGVAFSFVSLVRRRRELIFVLGVIAVACVVSVLPYLGPFWHESHYTVVFGGEVELSWLWEQFCTAFGPPASVMSMLWLGLCVAAVGGAIIVLSRTRRRKPGPEWDLLLFGAIIIVASLVAYFGFLKLVSYRTRDWYYLALLAILAGAIELIVANLARTKAVRIARLIFVLFALTTMPFAVWPKLIERQTNMDFIAHKLEEAAQPSDLIVINPWFLGVAFNRYYHGEAPWMTVPNIDDHRVHRFDLIKEKLASSAPIDDLLGAIKQKLQVGGQVWFVGNLRFLAADRTAVVLPPAPTTEYGWNGDAYAESWSQQLGMLLRDHALGGQAITVPAIAPVNELENIPVTVARGWRD